MKRYYPELDRLRFWAWLSVFVSHCIVFLWQRHYEFAFGDLGVALFFVLSGFLITGILIDEYERRATLSLAHFYTKRVGRIWPLYFITLAVGFAWVRWGPHLQGIPTTGAPWWMFTFFLGNVALILTPALSPILAVLWSVSVEEQFYLLWPLVFRALRGKIALLLVGIIVLSTVYRVVYFDQPSILLYATPSVIGYIALGALAAWGWTKEEIRDVLLRSRHRILYATLSVIFLLLGIRIRLVLQHAYQTRIVAGLLPLLFGVAFAMLILALATRTVVAKKFSRAMVYLGKISYGLYCYHMVALLVVMSLLGSVLNVRLALASIAAILTVLLAALSYRYIERPIMRRASRFADEVSF